MKFHQVEHKQRRAIGAFLKQSPYERRRGERQCQEQETDKRAGVISSFYHHEDTSQS